MTNSVSILIISFNRPDDLLELLQGLSTQKNLDSLEETLILDNASTVSYQPVLDFISTHNNLKVNFIRQEENLGVARGRNLLMAQAKGNILLVLDDDVLFYTEDDFERLSLLLEKPFFKKANTAVVTPKIIYAENKQLQVTAFPHKKFKEYSDKTQFLTSYFTGCAHLIKKEVLEKTGLYPADFFYGMEEYDLSYRVINAGYAIGYDNEVTLMHKESAQGRQANYKKLKMQWINKSKVSWRYLPFIYFKITAIAWSFQYLLKAKGHLGSYFGAWKQIFKIPFKEQKNKISKEALSYLKKVEARLWY
jgi:GT2 family glycosyltransferase